MPSRQSLIMKPSGERHFATHAAFVEVHCHAPAATSTTPAARALASRISPSSHPDSCSSQCAPA
jgi:hypothetical protein